MSNCPFESMELICFTKSNVFLSNTCCNKSSLFCCFAGRVEQCSWRSSLCYISGGRLGEPGRAADVSRIKAASRGLYLLPERRGVFLVLFGSSFLYHL